MRVCSMASFLCLAAVVVISSVRPFEREFADDATPWNHVVVRLHREGKLECYRSVGVPQKTVLPAAIRDERPAKVYGPLEYHYWGSSRMFDGWTSLDLPVKS